MKKIVLVFSLLLAVMGFVSCGDWVETSGNGKLDGMWQLIRIDTLATESGVDMAEDRKYLAVQGKILEVHDADESGKYMFRFSYTEGRLSLSDARSNDRESDDPKVTDVSVLAPYGINSLNETFDVEKLTGSKLVLVSDVLRLTYRKF
ncbi:MAG: lipocalin-like domain-containing protein [Prevotella sp.]|jgi:hypothetical protein